MQINDTNPYTPRQPMSIPIAASTERKLASLLSLL
jgi:hypothetical protein